MSDYQFIINDKNEVAGLWLATRAAAENGDLCLALIQKHYGGTECGSRLLGQLAGQDFTWGTSQTKGGWAIMFNSPVAQPELSQKTPAASGDAPAGRKWWQFWKRTVAGR